MKKILFLIFIPFISFAQNETDSIHNLDEVVIQTRRISIPFTENSHTISILDSLEIAVLSSSTVDEILQNLTGIDVRRRGIEGMQSDIYIRGGSYEQVLILIDGVKMDDLQTGHHAMNAIISPDNIERIEVIKGAASRIYGQNAMNGAINIITKNALTNATKVNLRTGSYGTIGASVNIQQKMDAGSIQFHIDKLESEGYRYNSDFDNWNAFFKTNIHSYELLATYSERKFGANGFYASPLFKEQYEETQTHLLALKRIFTVQDWKMTTQTYWRRNQDMYLFVRTNPNLYRNLHISNKIGISIDANYSSKIGSTGLGLDINQGYLNSNNLGNHQRLSSTIYAEHRFQILDNKIDITPGVAVSYYNDFGIFAYPGIDIGYKLNSNFKFYLNSGFTSRIPTFTNLYYNSSAEQGNPDLKPETSLTNEGGIYIIQSNFLLNMAYFYRNAFDLIDWAKDNVTDKWQARNFGEVVTRGFETSLKYRFKLNRFNQNIQTGYTFMKEDIIEQNVAFSRYSLNSFKHQLTAGFHSQFHNNLTQNIAYRYIERTLGETYHVFDAGVNLQVTKWKFQMSFNNIFDTKYSEANLVPMPQFHMMGSLSYQF